MSQYDAIIVGARIAGSAMAAFLSRAGFRVLLIDRIRHPQPALSCPFFFANTLDMCRRIGVLPAVDAIGAPKFQIYRVRTGDLLLRGRMLPYQGIDYAYSIQRQYFDEVLFNHVAALPNVETRLGANMTELIWDEGHARVIGVRASTGGGPEESLYADLVVGADGVYSSVARQVDSARYEVKPPHSCVYYAYYSNVEPSGGEIAACIYRDIDAPCYFVTGNSDHDLTVISLSLPAAYFREARQNPDALHLRYAAGIPEVAGRLRGAVRETPVSGVAPRESYFRVPYGPGWVLVGDAGYYKDPITGQGINDGMRSAELAAAAYAEYRAGAEWNAAMGRFQATRDREMRALYNLTDLYAQVERQFTPQEMDLFRSLSQMPHWADRYVSLFNGVTDVATFTAAPNILRIMAEWRARQLWQRLTGQPMLHPAETEPLSA